MRVEFNQIILHNFLSFGDATLNINNDSFNFKLFFLYLMWALIVTLIVGLIKGFLYVYFVICFLWGFIHFIYQHTIFHHNYI